MRRRLTMVAGVLLAAVSANAGDAGAQSAPFALEGKQIPLPAGDWVPAARLEEADLTSVVLLQAEAGRVSAAVLVQASRQDRRAGWGATPDCERRDLPFARTRHKSDHDQSCAYVARVITGAGAGPQAGPVDAAWAQARRFAAAQGWRLPVAWGIAVIRVAQPVSAVQIRYAVALDEVPDPQALAGWTETAWTAVERGLHNGLDEAPPLPALTGLSGTAKAPAAPEAEGFSLSRAVWKTITFRVIGTSIDFAANLIATGNVATAATLSAFPIILGPWVYLGHELAWDHYGQPAGQRATLPGLGAEVAWPVDGSAATRMAGTAP